MVHNRRARPTLRVLREDLTSDWASPEVHRALNEGGVRELGALSELPHPVLAKCLAHFGSDGPMRTPEGLIRSASQYPMWEVKVGQWRAGVWRDPATGVHWLLAAGLAKGGHGDGDDFYQRVMRVHSAKRADTWLPTQEDAGHLKAETAARLLTEWELGIQKSALRALEAVHGGGEFSFDLRHPIEERVEPGHAHMASVTVTVDLVRGRLFLQRRRRRHARQPPVGGVEPVVAGRDANPHQHRSPRAGLGHLPGELLHHR